MRTLLEGHSICVPHRRTGFDYRRPHQMSKHKKRDDLLGMSFGTARSRLVKMLLFDLVTKAQLNVCHRCERPILTLKEFSIEHTESWQLSVNPREVYFDISKIKYSHLLCNSAAATPMPRKEHGPAGYRRGCRCETCVAANGRYNANWSAKRSAVRKSFRRPESHGIARPTRAG